MDFLFDCFEGGVWQKLDRRIGETGLSGGVYQVHLIQAGVQPLPEHFQPVSRLLKPDPKGRLYIGMATDFRVRFIELRKSLHPEYLTDAHAFARAALRHFSAEQLALSVRFHKNPAAAEREALWSYRDEFGELPPFNAIG